MWSFMYQVSNTDVSALMSQSDACPTGDQEAGGLVPARSDNFLLLRLGNTFYSHSLPPSDSGRAIVSFWQKNVYKYCLTP